MMSGEKAQSARDAILAAMAEDPVRTVGELTKIANCSRQRVHMILKQEGLEAAPVREVRKARGIVVAPKSRMVVAGPVVNISHSSAGTVGEMLAAADLITRGWFVFFPLVRTAKCDLLALSSKGLRTARIEVRSGRRVNGSLAYNRKPNEPCDYYAVILPGEPIVFVPEIGLGQDA